jgi:hypothetical protein
MTQPPHIAEAMLRSLGAQSGFCEPLLGDLAEGFATRVDRDGIDSARRWYWRETIRAVPHLLADWRRSLRAPDIRHLAGVVLTSYVFMAMFVFLGVALAQGAADALGSISGTPAYQFSRVQLVALWLPVAIASTVLGGYLAAWLDKRAPLASAIAVGLTWAAISLVVGGITREHAVPLWYWLFAAALQVLGPTVGGLLCVRRLGRPPQDHLQS